uniref:Uncharacterized protein n=1 Tax=Nelumbo nucifera TaxID=4432 RepID=A0A822YMJ3_NELNU|nr:TPA_asm: hypothetical protein HUJ06_012558 [Nelumbo nucifera]
MEKRCLAKPVSWVGEHPNPKFKRSRLCFSEGNFSLIVLGPLTGPFSQLEDSSTPTVNVQSELQTIQEGAMFFKEGDSPSTLRACSVPILHHDLTHHNSVHLLVPTPTIAQKIVDNLTRWGSDLSPRGDSRWLSGFWDWGRVILREYRTESETAGIYSFVLASTYDYERPMGMYRASCETWCRDTNTFT